MATVSFGNYAADMRLEDAGYGIAFIQQFNDFINAFQPLREQVLVREPTFARVREFDAANNFITVSLWGNLAQQQISQMEVQAGATILQIVGAFVVDGNGNLVGTATALGSWHESAGIRERLVEYSKLSVAVDLQNFNVDLVADPILLAGNDSIAGGNGGDYLIAYAGNDTVAGGAGADTLEGAAGADRLSGGSGNDTFVVGDMADTVIEEPSGGTDTVIAVMDFTLPANVEHLLLDGYDASSGTGNGSANRIQGDGYANRLVGLGGADTLAGADWHDSLSGGTGNDSLDGGADKDRLDGGDGDDTLLGGAGADTLLGGAGLDSLAGGAGNDNYLVASGDRVVELAGGGFDTVQSAIAWTLAAGVERLLLVGEAHAAGTGNALANTLRGNTAANLLSGLGGADTLEGGSGRDTLAGGAGDDRLEGGLGADAFVFASALSAASNVDTLVDFVSGVDALRLDDDVFGALTAGVAITPAQFLKGAGLSGAQDGNDRLIYDTASGALYYDADGVGGLAAVQFAQLGTGSHPELRAADFLVVA